MPLLCLVLEFEPIYREEAKARRVEIGKQTGRGHKRSSINDTEPFGQSRAFMARDAAVSENSIQRVLYIREHDPGKFKALKELISG